jgi:rhodanese-related sulfurtransferase
MSKVTTIEVKALCDLMQREPQLELIDVRTPGEYESTHACGAKLIPLDQLDPQQVMQTRKQSAAPLYLICKGGTRSGKAAEKFIAAGYSNVVSVAGGTEAWVSAGLPVESTGRSVLPLDRQIQFTAGSMCLTGAILGTFVNPWFYILCGIVGFGLTMAGLTGLCPMAILMAKMPWNRGSKCTGTSCGCK